MIPFDVVTCTDLWQVNVVICRERRVAKDYIKLEIVEEKQAARDFIGQGLLLFVAFCAQCRAAPAL